MKRIAPQLLVGLTGGLLCSPAFAANAPAPKKPDTISNRRSPTGQ